MLAGSLLCCDYHGMHTVGVVWRRKKGSTGSGKGWQGGSREGRRWPMTVCGRTLTGSHAAPSTLASRRTVGFSC